MKRIDSINARPDANGIGKVGFSDNADLSGQDATYLTPDWLNHLQEELCNLIELNGISLNADSKQQLFNLLTTQSELVALSDAIESNFIRKSQKGAANGVAPLNVQSIIDSSFLPISSLLKAGIVQLVNDLTTGGTDKALSAEQGKLLVAGLSFLTATNGYLKLPNYMGGLILQWGVATITTSSTWLYTTATLPLTFPTACVFATGNVGLLYNNAATMNTSGPMDLATIEVLSTSLLGIRLDTNANVTMSGTKNIKFLAIGY